MEVDLSMVFIGYISKISDFLDPTSLNTAKNKPEIAFFLID